MRQITTTLYTFDELSDAAKDNARDWYRKNDGALDYGWWDSTYEWLADSCNAINLEVDLDRTYFTGFYVQGSGAAMKSGADVIEFIDGIASGRLDKENRILAERLDPPPAVHHGLRKLVDEGVVMLYVKSCPKNNSVASVDIRERSHIDPERHPRLFAHVTELTEYAMTQIRTIASWLFDTLKEEYEYLMSDESVDECILANGYEFDEDGNRA